ncbi:ABC transporter [Platysternon megacephalum]|uniref:ABC transporter n=1 Tax=Platysternon megacephalum TaxID=55544 RepID=A0A4D9DIC2_9SAUR|nr:ABC transporter [Platysternon megacephalum]
MAAGDLAGSFQDEVTCCICLEYFTDPVTIECGHNFCRACISQCWGESEPNFSCPQCRETAQQRNLQPNRQLGNVVEFVKRLGLQAGSEPEGQRVCERHQETLKPGAYLPLNIGGPGTGPPNNRRPQGQALGQLSPSTPLQGDAPCGRDWAGEQGGRFTCSLRGAGGRGGWRTQEERGEAVEPAREKWCFAGESASSLQPPAAWLPPAPPESSACAQNSLLWVH